MAKLTQTNISGIEKQLLKQYAKSAPLVLVRFKAQAILMATKGMTATDIGDILDRKERAVVLWMRDWQKRRLSSIFTGHRGNNNAGKLTKQQVEEVKQVLQSPPSEHGLPKEFWDIPQLKQYVKAEFGVVYESDESYYFLIRFSHLSFKYPDTFDRKRN